MTWQEPPLKRGWPHYKIITSQIKRLTRSDASEQTRRVDSSSSNKNESTRAFMIYSVLLNRNWNWNWNFKTSFLFPCFLVSSYGGLVLRRLQATDGGGVRPLGRRHHLLWVRSRLGGLLRRRNLRMAYFRQRVLRSRPRSCRWAPQPSLERRRPIHCYCQAYCWRLHWAFVWLPWQVAGPRFPSW